MSGKAALILVMGFSLIYLFIARFWNGITGRAVDNYADYFKLSVAHNIAMSGANMELSKIYLDSWEERTFSRPFSGGSMSVTTAQTDSVTRLITSVGTFMGQAGTVKVKIMRNSLAKYAWFTGSVSGSRKFITGDKVWGGFHSNPAINIEGSPVFYGKVTTSKGFSPSFSRMSVLGYKPQFWAGYRTGVEVEFDNNYSFTSEKNAAISGGKYFPPGKDLWMTFHSDGTVSYRTGNGNDSSKYSSPVRTPVSVLAANGVIFVEKGNIYLSGVLNGKAVVVADQSSGSGGGNVFFVNDMTYSKEPVRQTSEGEFAADYSCTDLLEVLASNNAVVATAATNSGKINNVVNKDLNVCAAIFCAKGGLRVENWTDVQTPAGVFTLKGSMVAGVEEEMAKLSFSHILQSGYYRHIIFDERFYKSPPSHIPLSSDYNIVSWLE